MKVRKGFYAGSFNPFHVGHLDIFRQAEKVFDVVIIGVGQNINKPLASVQSIVDNIKSLGLTNEIVSYGRDLSAALKSFREPVALIRGLRNTEDFAAEAKMANYLKTLVPGLTISYFLASNEVVNVSSSAIRELLDVSSHATLDLARKLTVQPVVTTNGQSWYTPPPTRSSDAAKKSMFDSLKGN